MPNPPLSPPEQKLLRTLWNRGPLTRGAAKTDVDTARRLLAVSLIEELPPANKRSKPKLSLTEAGRAVAGRLPPAKPTQLDVFRQVAALRDELESLRQLVAGHLGSDVEEPPAEIPAIYDMPATLRSGDPTPGQPTLEQFGQRLRQAVAELDQRERLSGLVPVPLVRSELKELGLSRDAFDDALLALEEQYVIDLKVANDPSRLSDRDQGIDTSDRGLLYFVVVR